MVSARLILSDVSLCACCAGSLNVRLCTCSVLEMSGGLGNRRVMYVPCNIPYSTKISLDKILLNGHTLYLHKKFAEFNFTHSASCSSEVVGGALE